MDLTKFLLGEPLKGDDRVFPVSQQRGLSVYILEN